MAADGTLSMNEPGRKWKGGFWSLIATQFQGAFNENALKFLVIYLILAIEKEKSQRDQLLIALRFFLFNGEDQVNDQELQRVLVKRALELRGDEAPEAAFPLAAGLIHREGSVSSHARMHPRV